MRRDVTEYAPTIYRVTADSYRICCIPRHSALYFPRTRIQGVGFDENATDFRGISIFTGAAGLCSGSKYPDHLSDGIFDDSGNDHHYRNGQPPRLAKLLL